jgi:hypothetical protein
MSSGYIFDDGGREAAGFKGTAGDCVCRSIAVATGIPYREIYDALNELAKSERIGKRKKSVSSARTGVYPVTYRKYLASLGWKWVPTMQIGQGCTVHLSAAELPAGRIIVKLSRHLTAMIDGVIHDNHDPRRYAEGVTVEYKNGVKSVTTHNGEPNRCVYGYFIKE